MSVKTTKEIAQKAPFISSRVLSGTEKVLAYTHEHWIHVIYGINWLVILSLFGYGLSWSIRTYLGSYLGAPYTNVVGIPLGLEWWWLWYIFTFFGFVIFLVEFITYTTSEVVVTDARIIIKRGLVFVDVTEVDLGEIRHESIDHKMLGRFFYYGDINMDARFVGDLVLPAMDKPHQFLRIVHKARSRISDEIEK